MRKIYISTGLLLLAISVSILSCKSTRYVEKHTADLVKVKQQMDLVIEELRGDFTKFSPSSATITFETSSETGGSIGGKVGVFTGSYSYAKGKTSEISYEFNFAPKSDKNFTQNFKEELAKVISNAIAGATNLDSGELTEFTVSVAFAVKQEGEFGAEGKIELIPITPSLKGKRSKEAVHKVEIKFKKV